MTHPTAIIAEDETPQRQELRALLAELWPELNIVAECEDGLSALEAMCRLRNSVACACRHTKKRLCSNFGLLGTLPRPIIFLNRAGFRVLWLRRRAS